MGRSRTISLLVAILVCLLAVAACGSSSSASTAPTAKPSASTAPTTMSAAAKTAACNGVSTINQALTSLSSVNGTTTVGDVKTAQAKVTAQVNVIKPLVPSSDGALVSQLSAANTQLSAQIAGYSDQTPISKTSVNVAGVKSRVATAQSTTNNLSSYLNCTV
ncbi:MAG: hypothetical protein ACLQUY_10250 [Ktedonobacterales bacterium]